uniref:Major Facilitator Superfamily (MFS) putative n=1 Tax=Albugo laibachii Nc14 TaxID=890382 RepID=F0W0F3_9STRA|nr:Major Facilitator Superfamily (MFS) putative [Albugo laibachii Nc14]|eukprot:CCA14525.1 Major Facilitator Superfamily (MFS) putative [Albugo laibachii Nc14]
MPQTLLNLRAANNYGSTERAIDHKISPKHRLKSWYLQMFLINLVEFSAESSRGIVLPTLYLYGKSLGGSIAFMGILTSVFSVGRLISSTVFGWMCDRWTFKAVYIISSVICLFGNILYLLADQHVVNSKYLLAVSRFIVGFGAGNRSVCRANVAAITTVGQRLKYLTILATVVFLGYALTPGLGSLVANIDVYFLGVHFNQLTSPGMILVILSGLTIILVLLLHEEDLGIHDGPCETPDDRFPKKVLDSSSILPTNIVNIGAAVFIFLNFNARGILSVFETINIPLFLEVTGSSPKSIESVAAASNFQFYLGLLGLFTYLFIEYFRHKISDVCWVQTGFSMLFVGNILLVVAPFKLTFFRLTLSEVFVWSIGCPITSAVIIAAFSKLLGGRPQGTLMGLLGSAGSVSRIVLPLLPGVLGTLSPVFLINIVLCGISILSLAWYSRLVYAFKEDAERKGEMSTSQGSGQA